MVWLIVEGIGCGVADDTGCGVVDSGVVRWMLEGIGCNVMDAA